MKTLKRITLAMAFMSLIISQVYSQNAQENKTQKDAGTSQTMNSPAPGKFVDNNHDGVCDNHQAKMKNGKCSNFVDKNGDGICDKKAACQGKCNPNGCGMGCSQKGQGQGNPTKRNSKKKTYKESGLFLIFRNIPDSFLYSKCIKNE